MKTTSQNSNSNTRNTITGQEISPQLSVSTRSSEREGNCEVVDTIGEEVFKELGKNKSDYTTIFCRNTDSVNSEPKLASNWIGLFHNDLLLPERESFTSITKFNLETVTMDEDEDEEYETTFIGNSFLHSSLTGKWGTRTKDISEKSIAEVTVEEETDDSPKIYLLFSKKK